MEHKKMRQATEYEFSYFLALIFVFTPRGRWLRNSLSFLGSHLNKEKKGENDRAFCNMFFFFFFSKICTQSMKKKPLFIGNFVMWQGSMDNKATWPLINYDKVESTPHKSFISFTDTRTNFRFTRQPLLCLLVLHLAMLCYSGHLVVLPHHLHLTCILL